MSTTDTTLSSSSSLNSSNTTTTLSTDTVKHKYRCEHDTTDLDNCQMCGRVHCSLCYPSPFVLTEINLTFPFAICSSCRINYWKPLMNRIPPLGTIITKCNQHTSLTIPNDNGIITNCKLCTTLNEFYRLLMIETVLKIIETLPMFGHGETKTNLGKASATAVLGIPAALVSATVGAIGGVLGGAVTGALGGAVLSSAKTIDAVSSSSSSSTSNSTTNKKDTKSTTSTPKSTDTPTPPSDGSATSSSSSTSSSAMMAHAKAILKMSPEEQQIDAEKEITRIKECKSLYDILELPKTATITEIKAAHRAKSMAYHPDRNSSPLANEVSQAVNNAYAVLGDDDKKQKYDATGGKDTSGVDVNTGGVTIDIKVSKKGAALAKTTGFFGGLAGAALGATTGAVLGFVGGITGTVQTANQFMKDHIKAEDTIKNRINNRRILLNKEMDTLLKTYRTLGINVDTLPSVINSNTKASSSATNTTTALSSSVFMNSLRLSLLSQISIQSINLLTNNNDDNDNIVTTSNAPSILVQISIPYDYNALTKLTASEDIISNNYNNVSELRINRFITPEIQQDLELVVNDVFLKRIVNTVPDNTDKEYTARLATAFGEVARAQRQELGVPEPQGPTDNDYDNNNNTHISKDATGISGGDDYETRLAAETVNINSMKGLFEHANKEVEKQVMGIRAQDDMQILAILGARAEAYSLGKEPTSEWISRRVGGILGHKENDSTSTSTTNKLIPITDALDGWSSQDKEQMKVFEQRWTKMNQLNLQTPCILIELALVLPNTNNNVNLLFFPVRTFSIYEKQRKFRITKLPQALCQSMNIAEIEKLYTDNNNNNNNNIALTLYIRIRMDFETTSTSISSVTTLPSIYTSTVKNNTVQSITLNFEQLKQLWVDA